MAPLDHMFDDHHLCDSNWCYKKRIQEEDATLVDEKSEKMKLGYYIFKVMDKGVYEKMYKKYKFYTMEEEMTQFTHEFDTYIHKGMNTRVSKYAPKTKHYSKSISLEARVKTAADIYNCGYHLF